MQISNAQSRAIAHQTGPAMILAGPGSGKTLVITQRTKYLIEQCGVKPHEILVITFTKAAALEMRSRFFDVCDARGVTFGTFHAVFFTILKHAYRYSAANILSEDQKFQILKQLIREHQIPPEEEKDLLTELSNEISLVKNEQINLEHYYAKCISDEKFRTVFQHYEKIHREQGLLDFDDMMTYTKELLTARPDILAAWQNKFKYILVDEFQDINLLQYQILKLLAAPQNNLFIVGDDDQSIYRFRGAKPEIMLNFPKEYPDTATILLDYNFRSVPAIIKGAVTVIEENQNRYRKKIQAVRKGGSGIMVREFDHQDHESLYLVKKIEELIQNGVSPSEIAVLFRTNQGAGPFAQRLMEFNIPFEMRDVLPNIYEHWIAKDLFAYLHLALEKLDRASFLQIMNRPARYISRDCIDAKIVSFETLRTYYEDKDWMLDRIDRMELDLQLLRQMTPFASINYIRHGIHYEEYLQEYARTRRMKVEDLTDILDEIQQSAKPYRTFDEWFAQIEAFREKLKESRGKKEKQEDVITLATLHSSKGLEFQEVFLVDVNEGIIPHRKASVEADLEEERRLFYVGMTRAKDHLHIYYVKERYGKTMEPSPFLESLLPE